METIDIMNSLVEAATIVRRVRVDVANTSSAVWEQVNRVYTYLDKQVAELLASCKSGHVCKFCGAQWDEDSPCEAGMDPETFESYWCGNQSCPACLSCQGRTDVTAETITAARAIAEHRKARV